MKNRNSEYAFYCIKYIFLKVWIIKTLENMEIKTTSQRRSFHFQEILKDNQETATEWSSRHSCFSFFFLHSFKHARACVPSPLNHFDSSEIEEILKLLYQCHVSISWRLLVSLKRCVSVCVFISNLVQILQCKFKIY